MSDLMIAPKLRQLFVTHIGSNYIWAQSDSQEVIKFESIYDLNYKQMCESFFEPQRGPQKPFLNKHYIFCDKSKNRFYRVLVKEMTGTASSVVFIDFGYEELVPNVCLFVFEQLFIGVQPLAQKFFFDENKTSVQSLVGTVNIFVIFNDNFIELFNEDNELVSNWIAIGYNERQSSDISGRMSSVEELNLNDKTDENSIKLYLNSLFETKKVVYISKAFSEKSVFIQLKDSYEEMEEFSAKINGIYGDSEEYRLQLQDLTPDMLIAAQFSEDNRWYRATIEEIIGHKLKVFYIDFGNSETIDIKDCRKLVPELKEVLPFAIHCKPLNDYLESEDLEVFATNEQPLECLFKQVNDKTIDVLLYDSGHLLGSDSMENTPKVVENPEIIELKDKYRKSKELFERNEKYWKSFESKEEFVLISRVINTKRVFIRLEKTVIPDMKEFYNCVQTLTAFQIISDKNILIAVYSRLRNNWFRAVVRKVNDDSVLVFFVDSGHEETVPKANCQLLADQFFSQVFGCVESEPKNEKILFYDLKEKEISGKVLKLGFICFSENVFKVLIK